MKSKGRAWGGKCVLRARAACENFTERTAIASPSNRETASLGICDKVPFCAVDCTRFSTERRRGDSCAKCSFLSKSIVEFDELFEKFLLLNS